MGRQLRWWVLSLLSTAVRQLSTEPRVAGRWTASLMNRIHKMMRVIPTQSDLRCPASVARRIPRFGWTGPEFISCLYARTCRNGDSPNDGPLIGSGHATALAKGLLGP